MLLGEENIKKVVAERTFKTNQHYLEHRLGMSKSDTRHELLIQYMFERNRNINEQQWMDEWKNNKKVQLYKITYARMDIERQYFNNVYKSDDDKSILNGLLNVKASDNNDDNTDYLDYLQANLRRIFVGAPKTRKAIDKFINCENNIDDRTMRNIKGFRENHQQQLEKEWEFQMMSKKRKELDFANNMLNIENAPGTLNDKDIEECNLIEIDKSIAEDLIGKCNGIHNQNKLLNDWKHADNADKLKFIEYLEGMIAHENARV